MAYKNNIPQPSDNLSVSQNDILNNFAQLDTTMGVNHFNFSDVSGNTGKHTFVEMVKSGGVPTIVANEGAIYTKTSSSITNAFYTADAGGKEYQLTKAIDANFSTFGNSTGTQNSGWTFLPGGLLLQYGNNTAVSSSSGTTITYPIAFTTAVFSVQGTVVTNDSSTIRFSLLNTAGLINFTTTQTSTSHFTNLYWIAIGL